jgi:hypothetical protein
MSDRYFLILGFATERDCESLLRPGRSTVLTIVTGLPTSATHKYARRLFYSQSAAN